MTDPIVLLRHRVRVLGATPLLTRYAGGARTELSATTLANWVDKTVQWMLTEDLADVVGDETPPVALPVLADHPRDWMSLVWVLACWQAGCSVDLTGDGDVELVVAGPAGAPDAVGAVRVRCSLHPLGLGLQDLPDGELDYSDEVRPQPDTHEEMPATATSPAWCDGTREVLRGDLLVGVEPRSNAALVDGTDPWQVVREALLAPLLGGGSTVLVDPGTDEAELARIRTSERLG